MTNRRSDYYKIKNAGRVSPKGKAIGGGEDKDRQAATLQKRDRGGPLEETG